MHSIHSKILVVFLLCIALFPLGAAPINNVQGVSITVQNMERSVDFYTKILGFTKVDEQEVAGANFERLFGVFGARARVIKLKLGTETIELVEYLAPSGRPIPIDSQSHDRWFQHIAIIVSDIRKAYQILRDNHVQQASTGPQTLPAWNKNAAGIQAFYFKDPDQHVLEILQFPEDKGDAKWKHSPKDALFLGIDHTAIVVKDTDASIRFYRDVLGLKIIGESENYGPEQERLNNVFGARLRITTLKAPVGIAVELLEYLSPTTGRDMPVDTKSNDIWHWSTLMNTDQIDALEKTLRKEKYRFISPGVLSFEKSFLHSKKAMTARDPDGHALLFTQPEN